MVKPNMSRIFVILVILLTSATALWSVDVPPLRGRINDTAGVLSSNAADDLENYLAAVERTSGAQIALLTVDSLDGEPIESYGLRVADQWKLGTAESDNGALLLVAMAEKKVRIEVGYGLEGNLTDAMSGFIIREVIVPEFKRGNFDTGISEGLKAMGGQVTGDAPLDTRDVGSAARDDESEGVPLFFLIFLFVFIFGRLGRYRHLRRRGMSPMSAFFLGSMLGGATRGRSGFGSSSGGFSGGGFSGGGGGFGGGGASGGW